MLSIYLYPTHNQTDFLPPVLRPDKNFPFLLENWDTLNVDEDMRGKTADRVGTHLLTASSFPTKMHLDCWMFFTLFIASITKNHVPGKKTIYKTALLVVCSA